MASRRFINRGPVGDSSGYSSASAFEQERIHPSLARRREIGSLRRLTPFHEEGSLDFSSNDYLGLAQCSEQHKKVQQVYEVLSCTQNGAKKSLLLGSTGSRLLTGDSKYAHGLEARLAEWHNRPAALLCNSGYDANLSVLSCLTLSTKVIMDELSHNSIQMGVRLSKDCEVQTFRHNSLQDLRRLLEESSMSGASATKKPVLVVVESVYSMDGDLAPLKEILDMALKYQACVIVDEAHGLGVFGDTGMGVLERDVLEDHPALLCSVHTYGKAAGCHGAVICGSLAIKEYLLNYGRPIIYSTSLPIHSLVTIACSYESITGDAGRQLRAQVRDHIHAFRTGMSSIMGKTHGSIGLVDSISPIQALVIPGNSACIDFCTRIFDKSKKRVRLYPIRSPTVPKGQERVRIIVHSHNRKTEIAQLLSLIESTLDCMGFILITGGILLPSSRL